MDKPIAVVHVDREEAEKLCEFLHCQRYQTIIMNSLVDLEKEIREEGCEVVILDFDSFPVNDQLIRDLKHRHHGISYIIGVSKRCHHPELQEAMAKHIYACLIKPLDTEELFYLLKTIYQNRNSGEPHTPSKSNAAF